MEKNEIKQIVAKMIADGVSLSEIQKKLSAEHNVVMTFLDLRLMASELENIDWSKLNKEEPKKSAPPAAAPDAGDEDPHAPGTSADDMDEDFDGDGAESEEPAPSEGAVSGGKTVVEVSKLTRPGAVANGTVTFGSGASAEWILDGMGRLMFTKSKGKPTAKDQREFVAELQKMLS
jgi:hypothetical protein